jgi:signal transduction histidine kinase
MPGKPIILPDKIDLEAFISEQAHDLRTPFNHIIGFSKMTLNTVGDAPLTDYQKEDLGTIYRSGLRALSFINGLIDIARLNRREKEHNQAPVNLQASLEQSIAQWKKFNPGDSQVEIHLPESILTFLADEQMLKQVLAGFIGFVANYCDNKARLIISVDEQPPDLFFSFKSSGLKARQLPELDLAIAGYIGRQFVELMGGKILKAEEVDDGALIQFSLPK